jgi:hypothetical protein
MHMLLRRCIAASIRWGSALQIQRTSTLDGWRVHAQVALPACPLA